ncbi:hypothetical protein L6452_43194 [Arctium lappa]|uniref:Uncharacterized protein n=1 Tax=Arctium lappa TaxID=4217 RepID=A0ACB8XLJ1_ARCLA|nr:hypothetical protein L6452_43194 [Arctium lappa]
MMFSASVYSTTSNKKNSSTSLSEEAATSTTVSSSKIPHHDHFNTPSMTLSSISNHAQQHHLYPNHQKIKKKRNLPGNPDPDAEVIALSPKTLMATNRFVCEICNKGFQRDQNLQLHRRGHNLPWKLKQRNNKDDQIIKKRAYVCPEPSCVHHHPSRALGDLTGIKKHFCRKHGEKKWKCDKCAKIYAVQSDWKAHAKTCGTREYRCDCGTLFSRKDSFITHRAFCDALAEETARLSAAAAAAAVSITNNHHPSIINNVTQTPFNIQQNSQNPSPSLFPFSPTLNPTWIPTQNPNPTRIKPETIHHHLLPAITPPFYQEPSKELMMITSPSATTFHGLHVSTGRDHVPTAHLSATALLQKAATLGAVGDHMGSTMSQLDMGELVQVTTAAVISPEYQHMGLTSGNIATWQKTDRLTRDFLGLTGDQEDDDHRHGGSVDVSVRNMLTYTGGVEIPTHGFGFVEPTTASEAWGNC